MNTKPDDIPVNIECLKVVLSAFRKMRDFHDIDYNMQLTSSPERFLLLIEKLEKYENCQDALVRIPMNDHEWFDYMSLMYYGSRHAESLRPEINDFLDDLEEQYTEWEDNGFKPESFTPTFKPPSQFVF